MTSVMKKILYCVPFLLLCCFSTWEVHAWGKTGHAVVAEVAERYLKPKARRQLAFYLDGKSLSSVASDADKYRAVWTHDLGFVPVNPDEARPRWLQGFDFTAPLNIAPYSHMITVDRDFLCPHTDNLNGEFINNIAVYIERLASSIKEDDGSMSVEDKKRAISLIVHFVGDMHCPGHIVYRPDNQLKGKYPVWWNGQQYTFHGFWDKQIFDVFGDSSHSEIASIIDTASKKERLWVVSGDVYDHASDCARVCWPIVNSCYEGIVLPSTYPEDMKPVLYLQLRNAGYRLADVLNTMFR